MVGRSIDEPIKRVADRGERDIPRTIVEHVDSEHVTTKQFLLDTINERDRKYEQRFAALDKLIGDANLSIKEALAAALASTSAALDKATANTQAALTTANDNIRTALNAVDQRFGTIGAQMESFARKTEIEQALSAMEKAGQKSEEGNEKRFDEFRSMTRQFEKFALQSEVNVRIDSLTDKYNTLNALQLSRDAKQQGTTQGLSSLGAVVIGIAISISSLASIGTLFYTITHVIH